MKYFIVAGEISGDLHGANLVREIAVLDRQAEFKGVGGQHLKDIGVELLFGVERLAFMGFLEVVKNLRTIQKNFKEIKQSILKYKPDVVILIDYPGFNLRLAKWCKQQGFTVVYYISPKFWAWRGQRVQKVKMYVDLMLCILPFEIDFYKKHHYTKAYFVGHPLLDIIHQEESNKINRNFVALLPGSRKQEIQTLLPIMLEVAAQFPQEQFVVAGLSPMKDLYTPELPKNVIIEYDATYRILKKAKVAVVCSGTATLETALLDVPQVVVYKTSWLNYQIGKRVAKVQYISLPNLITNDRTVEELLQKDCNTKAISLELTKLLSNVSSEQYVALKEKLGNSEAAKNAAKYILELLV